MPITEAELQDAIRGAMEVEWSDVVRAKSLILDVLSDGEPHGVGKLQKVLRVADNVPEPAHREEPIDVSDPESGTAVVTVEHPVIARRRLAMAASEALVELIAQGWVVGTHSSPDDQGNMIIGRDSTERVPYKYRGLTTGVGVRTALPNFDAAFRLVPSVARGSDLWFLDPDIFTADLGSLELDERTTRSIAEAIKAYRRGLYLASASMLGAAFEGAWFAAGEKLRALDDRLAEPLEHDRAAKVQKLVSEVLSQNRLLAGTMHELLAQAGLMRELRNYGVHPREGELDHLERFFTADGAAMLLMQTATYMQRLADAVTMRLES